MPTPVSPSGQAVVVGATGEVGAAIVARLRKAGVPVVAVARDRDRLEQLSATDDESSPMSAAHGVIPLSVALNCSRRSRSRATVTTGTPALRSRATMAAPTSPVAPTTTACPLGLTGVGMVENLLGGASPLGTRRRCSLAARLAALA